MGKISNFLGKFIKIATTWASFFSASSSMPVNLTQTFCLSDFYLSLPLKCGFTGIPHPIDTGIRLPFERIHHKPVHTSIIASAIVFGFVVYLGDSFILIEVP